MGSELSLRRAKPGTTGLQPLRKCCAAALPLMRLLPAPIRKSARMPRERGERPAGTRVALPGSFCLGGFPAEQTLRTRQPRTAAEMGRDAAPLTNLRPVGHHLPNSCDIGLVHLGQLLQLAHA